MDIGETVGDQADVREELLPELDLPDRVACPEGLPKGALALSDICKRVHKSAHTKLNQSRNNNPGPEGISSLKDGHIFLFMR